MKKEYTLKLGIAAKKPFQNSGLPLKSMECPITTRNENKNLKKSKLLLFWIKIKSWGLGKNFG